MNEQSGQFGPWARSRTLQCALDASWNRGDWEALGWVNMGCPQKEFTLGILGVNPMRQWTAQCMHQSVGANVAGGWRVWGSGHHCFEHIEQINWTFYRKNIQISQEDLRILKAFAVILWVCCLGRPARGVCQRDALRATSCGHGTSTTVGHKCRHYRQGLVGQAGKPLGTMAATSVAST